MTEDGEPELMKLACVRERAQRPASAECVRRIAPEQCMKRQEKPKERGERVC